MKTCYVDYDSRSIIDIVPPGPFTEDGLWLVTRVSVPKAMRGRGIASKLLKQVTEDADAEGVELVLEVVPDAARDGLDEEQLETFYARHGFVSDEWEFGCALVMRRAPR